MGGLGANNARSILGKDVSGAYSEVEVDGGKIAVIQNGHHEAHEDELVIASLYDNDVDTTAPLVIHLKPSTGDVIHCILSFTADAGGVLRIYETESTAITGDGTALLHMRYNRAGNTGDTEDVHTYHTPTESSAGVLRFISHNGGSTAGTPKETPAGGDHEHGEEFVIPPNVSPLLFTFTPDQNATKVSVLHRYYLH